MYKWIYRMRMGELGFLVRRQALAASETGNTKLNFLAKMTTAFCMVSSIPFLGVRPRPLNITTLERSFYLGTSDIYKVILPKSFLTLQIQESVLASQYSWLESTFLLRLSCAWERALTCFWRFSREDMVHVGRLFLTHMTVGVKSGVIALGAG